MVPHNRVWRIGFRPDPWAWSGWEWATNGRRLPEKAAAAIIEFVTGALAGDPHRLSKSLTNELLGLRTARRGDYRVLFTLDIEGHILYIHRIEHRSDVYKPR
ncbi:type II toxin-antitoxin system RelE family toxin [Arthrobacter sp. MA-N2]|uniref:type II toxin-antitoxin system RelE family toxin n=1 Tax=Arthrobacter sp. MA-N2 TaxID=1101188 RepID=UPI0004BC8FD3|nr:type II toxin-antitoxin system RelE/ParE family toxin [Arthrobacter sp. MA-N2]